MASITFFSALNSDPSYFSCTRPPFFVRLSLVTLFHLYKVAQKNNNNKLICRKSLLRRKSSAAKAKDKKKQKKRNKNHKILQLNRNQIRINSFKV